VGGKGERSGRRTRYLRTRLRNRGKAMRRVWLALVLVVGGCFVFCFGVVLRYDCRVETVADSEAQVCRCPVPCTEKISPPCPRALRDTAGGLHRKRGRPPWCQPPAGRAPAHPPHVPHHLPAHLSPNPRAHRLLSGGGGSPPS
jgi:hypothetical protein